ncbi:MAG: DUF4363 family protein [Eubacteriales bacterium]|nr:DUF4363 family protein [Eubacteriales bacterium]
MRRLWIAIALFALLIWGSVWSSRTVETTVDEIIAEIEAGRLEAAHEKWSAAETRFGALLLHEEIDEADRLFERVRTAKAAGEQGDYALDRAELLIQLRHLPDLEKPSLKNLF